MNISPKAGGFLCRHNYQENKEIAASGDRYPIHVILFLGFSEEEGDRRATHRGPDSGRDFSIKNAEEAPDLEYIQSLLRKHLVS